MTSKLMTLYGLKFHPFRPDVPVDALYSTPAVDAFCRRVEFGLGDGGFVMITGDPGCGKSVALRLLAHRLRALRDVGVTFPAHSRWNGFKSLRARWNEHIASTLTRPVLIIDEAQDMMSNAFTELRILASKELDSRSLLCIVLAGDGRLTERLRQDDLVPIGSRIRRRLHLDYASREDLVSTLEHLLEAAGNSALMTTELKTTIAEHAAGNYRIMMNMADELLTVAAERDLPRLDEKLYLELFAQPQKAKAGGKKR
jgi:type II secretory pathway predicted ATPase ExeA